MVTTTFKTIKYAGIGVAALVLVVKCFSPPDAAFAATAGVGKTGAVAATDSLNDGKPAESKSWLSEPKLRGFGFVWLPRVSYSEESGWGFGGHLLRPFRWGQSAQATNSEFRLSGRVTTKRQWAAEIRLRLGWADRKWSLNTKAGANTIARRFYGIGPKSDVNDAEVYQPIGALGYIELLRRVLPGMRIGVRAEFEYFDLTETQRGGILESGTVRGSQGGNVVGGGMVWDYDSRDRKYSPRTGSFHQAFAMRFEEPSGNQFDFDVYNVDLRKYLAIGRRHVLALQAFGYVTRGQPPFWRQAAMGGRAHSRGYRKGRYLDNALIAYQLEYRVDVWQRVGAVLFGGMADVGRTLGDINHAHMKPTLGVGSRIRLGGEDGVKARIELASGSEEVRFYMSLDEAF